MSKPGDIKDFGADALAHCSQRWAASEPVDVNIVGGSSVPFATQTQTVPALLPSRFESAKNTSVEPPVEFFHANLELPSGVGTQPSPHRWYLDRDFRIAFAGGS